MKRILMLCTLVLLLTGCSRNKESGLNPKDPENITIWHYYNGTQAIAFEEMVTEFNDTVGREKGIIVTVQSKSSIDELVSAVVDSANKKVGAEEIPNIFQCYLDTAVELDHLGVLTNLNQYVTEEEKSSFLEDYIKEGELGKEGEWKLFPIAKSTEVMVVNKTDWDKFAAATGVKEADLDTWEGLTETAEKFYDYSGGKSFFGRDAFANYMIIGSKQLGTEIFHVENGQVRLQIDKNAMKKLWDNFYVPYVKGYYKHVGRYRTDDVKLGEIIALVGSTTGADYFPTEVTIGDNDPYAIDYMILPVPNFAGTENYAVQQGANMAVSKSTERKEYASVVFLKWFTQSDRNMNFAVNSGYLPVKKEVNNYEKIIQYVEDNNIEMSGIELDVLKAGIDQASKSHLYTSKGFVGGYDARAVLENSMKDLAAANRELVLQAIGEGKTEQEAQEPYMGADVFEKWYLDITAQLEEICK